MPIRTFNEHDFYRFANYSRQNCEACDREFFARGGGFTSTRYCSEDCQRNARNARRREQRAEDKPTPKRRKCVVCGDTLREQKRSTRQTCSDACRQAAYRARNG